MGQDRHSPRPDFSTEVAGHGRIKQIHVRALDLQKICK